MPLDNTWVNYTNNVESRIRGVEKADSERILEWSLDPVFGV